MSMAASDESLTLPAMSAYQRIPVVLTLALALVTAAHALLHKRDPRSAWGWIAVCALFPLVGVALYWLFGINRLELRARRLLGTDAAQVQLPQAVPLALKQLPGTSAQELQELVHLGHALTGRRLASGNGIEPLRDGDQAYPAMLHAIAEARHSVHLASYIFLDDVVGQEFAAALAAAQARGARLRVLLDGVADAWNRPSASRLLARHGVRCARFLPFRVFPPLLHLNLRNHHKLLIVDQRVAFTGGMNISASHRGAGDTPPAITDLHFRITGPLVAQLEEVFLADWRFVTGEVVQTPAPTVASSGTAVGRAVTDGPNEELDRLLMLLLGALPVAHRRVWIMTPYFLPPPSLIGALQAAALRGVDVCLLLPEHSDQPWMDWATRNLLWQLLERQVRVALRPGAFAHSKLLVVDDYYVQFGSANLDTRSLRLNFELMVEVYDRHLALWAAQHFSEVRAVSLPLTLEQVNARSLSARLRDAACWLMSPYL